MAEEDKSKEIIKQYQSSVDNIIKTVKENYKKADTKKIQKAFEYAVIAHGKQERESGEPYIMHPVYVSQILADMTLDDDTIVAGLLHDVLEDTEINYDVLKKDFGESIANMVDGVTKLKTLKYTSQEETEVENYRRMFIAMAKDIRVILIRLADRLHNMRTLNYKNKETQLRKAKETLHIYAPIAHRLGMSKIKGELEDLSFKYISPEQYYEIVVGLDKKKDERELYLNEIKQDLEARTKKIGIKANISGRSKHIYSIYKKMQRDELTLNQVFDIFALRIIVGTVAECYTILGLIHEAYKPMPGRFKDYIAVPKENMYQSIHTTLIGKNAPPFEIQIRTQEMHDIAENGIAAHWAYKEANYKSKNKKVIVRAKEDKLSWIKQALEWQEDTRSPEEFMDALKTDLFEDEVYVFTPKGDIQTFPKGSIVIDFAYAIHEEIGNRMVGCKINTRIMPINTKLKTGDIVEIITSENSKGPSRDWVKMVKSPSAKIRIQQWFKRKDREENIEKGKHAVEKEFEKLGFAITSTQKKEWIAAAVKKNKFNNEEDLFATIGFGTISTQKALSKVLEEVKAENADIKLDKKIEKLLDKKEKETKATQQSGVIVEGLDNFLITFSKCCSPLPGEAITGYISRGRGVTIHRSDCPNIVRMRNEEERIVNVKWANVVKDKFTVDIELFALDRKQLLKDYIKVIEKLKINLLGIRAESMKDNLAITSMRVEVSTTEELESLMTALNNIENVFEVKRKKR